MPKTVAVEGDTKVETSLVKHPVDIGQSGSWQKGNLLVTTGEVITVGGKKVELDAQMTWEYIGGSLANGSPMPPVSDTATLVASPTKLRDRNRNILVNGDEAIGIIDSDNKITVEVIQDILRTV